MLSEASSTTVAALPITLQLGNSPERKQLLADILGMLSPSIHTTWDELVRKYGGMPFYDFLQKADISMDEFGKLLVKYFPSINTNVISQLG